MSNEPDSAPLRLFNAFAKSPELPEKCYYTVPHSIHVYFFRRLFAGRRGIYQELISPFISALYAECQRRGLRDERAVWAKENEQVVARILADLNFNDLTTLTAEFNALRRENESLRAQLRPSLPVAKRSPRKRRASASPDVPPGQS